MPDISIYIYIYMNHVELIWIDDIFPSASLLQKIPSDIPATNEHVPSYHLFLEKQE